MSTGKHVSVKTIFTNELNIGLYVLSLVEKIVYEVYKYRRLYNVFREVYFSQKHVYKLAKYGCVSRKNSPGIGNRLTPP